MTRPQSLFSERPRIGKEPGAEARPSLPARLGFPEDLISGRLLRAWIDAGLVLEVEALARARLALEKFLEGRPSGERGKFLHAAAETLAFFASRETEAGAGALEAIFGLYQEDSEQTEAGDEGGGSETGKGSQESGSEDDPKGSGARLPSPQEAHAGSSETGRQKDGSMGGGPGARGRQESVILIPFDYESEIPFRIAGGKIVSGHTTAFDGDNGSITPHNNDALRNRHPHLPAAAGQGNLPIPPSSASENRDLKASVAFSGLFRILVYKETARPEALFADFQANGNPYSFSVKDRKIKLTRAPDPGIHSEEAELGQELEALGFTLELAEYDTGKEFEDGVFPSEGIDLHA